MKRKILIILFLFMIFVPFHFAESTFANTTSTNKIILEDV